MAILALTVMARMDIVTSIETIDGAHTMSDQPAYIIEIGIPLPPSKSRNSGPVSALSAVLRNMKPGQSVFVRKEQKRASNSARMVTKATGQKFATRKAGDGCRVWCIAAPVSGQ